MDKRLGVIVSGSYDYNGRGIDDIEPVPTILTGTASTPGFSSMDLREYKYDRSRYGVGGNVDYKLGANSTLFVRTLFSDFRDYGHRWDYALATNDTIPGANLPGFNTERRLGDYQVASLILGGNHSIRNWQINWEGSVARSRMLNPIAGGESITSFNYIGSTSNCQYNPAANKGIYRPQFTADCFGEAYDPNNFALSTISQANHGVSAQLNLQGSASLGHSYEVGSHFGVFQLGGWFSNAHKFDNSYENDYTPNNTVLMSQFINGFKNSNYYDGSYQYGPIADWEKVNSFLAANLSSFTPTSNYGGNTDNFNLIERVSAGYLMNTFDFGRFSIYAGVRFEGTQDHTLSFDNTAGTLSVKGNNSYVSTLPSASLRFRIDNSSDVRLAYGRGISRPDPQFLTFATSIDTSTFPPTLTVGNPALKPEFANNYDVLYERFLKPARDSSCWFFL